MRYPKLPTVVGVCFLVLGSTTGRPAWAEAPERQVFNPELGQGFRMSENFARLMEKFNARTAFGDLYMLGFPITDPLTGPGIAEIQYFRVPGSVGYNVMEMHSDSTLHVVRSPRGAPKYPENGMSPADICKEEDKTREDCLDRPQIATWRRDWFPPYTPFPTPARVSTPKWETFACISTSNCNNLHFVPPFTTRNYDPPLLSDSGKSCSWLHRDPSNEAPVFGEFRLQWATLLYSFWHIVVETERWHQWRPESRGVNGYELHELMQNDPQRAVSVMQAPGSAGYSAWEDERQRPILWFSSPLEGVVANSHLSETDAAQVHREMKVDWWLGQRQTLEQRQLFRTQFWWKGIDKYLRGNPAEREVDENCGGPHAKGQLCTDWIIDVKPDPEYRYLLAQEMPNVREGDQPPCGEISPDNEGQQSGCGNFHPILGGNLTTEIEQWQVPGGFRPEVGDRIFMLGRWIVDCGHDDWHTELHPYELFVASHGLVGTNEIVTPEAANLIEITEAKVVVTSAWLDLRREADRRGGADRPVVVGPTKINIFPPARPFPGARLRWIEHPPPGGVLFSERVGVNKFDIRVNVTSVPLTNPNRLELELLPVYANLLDPSEQGGTGQGYSNDLYYADNRRWVTSFRLWWE